MVLDVHIKCGNQLFHHDILRLLLHKHRRLETIIHYRTDWSSDILWTWLVVVWIYGNNNDIIYYIIVNSYIIKHNFPNLYWYFNISIYFQLLYAAMNLTTNEMFNYKRYSYLKNSRGKYHNPYSRGLVYNLAEFFLCVQPVEPDDLMVLDVS